MQTIRRHTPTQVAQSQWPASTAGVLDTSSTCACLLRVNAAERQLLDALAIARESVRRCEQALELIAEARRLATIEHGPAQSIPPGLPDRLTTREAEVLRLIAAGHSNRRIADSLFLSPRTIERHIANIYLKIDAHNKSEATIYAVLHGLA